MSTFTSNYALIKPELTDAADITAYNANWDKIDAELNNINNRVVIANSTDGVAYHATVGGVTELYNGLEVTIVPEITSNTVNPTLNVNGLGAKNIKLPLGINTSAVTTPKSTNFFVEGRPVKLIYDSNHASTGIWRTVDKHRTSAQDLYGVVPVASGGTGSDDGAEGLKNLFAAGITVLSSNQYGDELPAPGNVGRIFFKKVEGQ